MEVLRNQVSVVLQKNTLFSGTILDNLRWGNPDATEEECIEACKAALLRASKNVLPNNFIEAKAEVAVDATGVSAADIQLPDGYKLSTDYGTAEELLKVRPFGTIFIVTKI